MAARIPLVINAGQIEQLQSGDNLNAATTGVDVVSKVNHNGSTMPPGTPVYPQSATDVDLARANASGTTQVLGLARAAILTTVAGEIQTDGILPLTTAQWDAITGQTGGLTTGAPYYLDSAAAGKLSATAPTAAGNFVIRLGLAISTTELDITVTAPIKL